MRKSEKRKPRTRALRNGLIRSWETIIFSFFRLVFYIGALMSDDTCYFIWILYCVSDNLDSQYSVIDSLTNNTLTFCIMFFIPYYMILHLIILSVLSLSY